MKLLLLLLVGVTVDSEAGLAKDEVFRRSAAYANKEP